MKKSWHHVWRVSGLCLLANVSLERTTRDNINLNQLLHTHKCEHFGHLMLEYGWPQNICLSFALVLQFPTINSIVMRHGSSVSRPHPFNVEFKCHGDGTSNTGSDMTTLKGPMRTMFQFRKGCGRLWDVNIRGGRQRKHGHNWKL